MSLNIMCWCGVTPVDNLQVFNMSCKHMVVGLWGASCCVHCTRPGGTRRFLCSGALDLIIRPCSFSHFVRGLCNYSLLSTVSKTNHYSCFGLRVNIFFCHSIYTCDSHFIPQEWRPQSGNCRKIRNRILFTVMHIKGESTCIHIKINQLLWLE